MRQRSFLLFGLGLALGGLCGWALGRSGPQSEPASQPRVRGPAAPTPAPQLDAEATAAARKLARLEEKYLVVVSDLDALRAKHEAALAAGEAARDPSGPAPPPLRIGFGPWQARRDLRATDWREAGGAAHELVSARRGRVSGEADAEAQARVRRAGLTLRTLLGPLRVGKDPLVRHPIVILNLIAAHLEDAELPLSDEQTRAIAERGESFARDLARFVDRWKAAGGGLLTELDLGRIRLEHALVTAVLDDVLTDAQRRVLHDPGVRGYVYYDLYQAGAHEFTKPSASTYWWNDREAAEAHLRGFLKVEWGLEESTLPDVESHLGAWLDAIVARGLHGPSASTVRIREALANAEIQIDFTKRLLQLLAADSPLRARILENRRFVLFPNFSG